MELKPHSFRVTFEEARAGPALEDNGGNVGRIEVDEEFCKGCLLCAGFCPQKLIRTAKHVSKKGYHPAEFDDPQGRCTGCTLCALICPDAAITVYRESKMVGERK